MSASACTRCNFHYNSCVFWWIYTLSVPIRNRNEHSTEKLQNLELHINSCPHNSRNTWLNLTRHKAAHSERVHPTGFAQRSQKGIWCVTGCEFGDHEDCQGISAYDCYHVAERCCQTCAGLKIQNAQPGSLQLTETACT